MTDLDRRLEALRLTKPDGVSVPDMDLWLGMADRIDAWLLAGSGQPPQEAPKEPATSPAPTAARAKRAG